jgi:rod shape-determining protein MreC
MRNQRGAGAPLAAVVLLVTAVLIAAPGPAAQTETLGVRVVAPIEFGMSRASVSVTQFVQVIQQAGELAAQNQTYREELARVQTIAVQMHELKLENEDLRKLLALRDPAPLGSLLSVNVIAQDPFAMVQALMIDRGSDDGVAVGFPVISWRGLVGRVVEVHPTASKVLLVTDVNSAVSARIQDPESRATGIIRGTGEGRLYMQYVPRADPLRTDDVVITSGVGGSFPAGLIVGRVVQVRHKDVDVFQEALVEPSVDMRSLERLYVLLRPANGSAEGP